MKPEVKTPVVRCVLLGENQSVLMFREDIRFENNTYSHWELPRGKVLSSENGPEDAAGRIVYAKTGLFASRLKAWPKPKMANGQVKLHDHHHYFLVQESKGKTFLDEHKTNSQGHKKVMGTFQWIEPDLLSCYLIRKETMMMLSRFLG